ncbi:MAG: polysaccharide biosynthesis/export family protein [Desulfobulbaceae bacterium]|nr:polysaccharide biosynthesis/export family protein [Desulfobulbaceae bacterium]
MRVKSSFYILMLATVCFACLSVSKSALAVEPETRSAPGQANGSEHYILGLGDVIEILVWKEQDLSRTLTIRLDGRISLPLVGDVMAADRSTQELSGYLEKKFSKIIEEPAVSVMLIENNSKRYYIIGQIAQPGEFPINYPLTALQAIARAGGFNEWAKTSRISIVRRNMGREKFLLFDYDSFIKGKHPAQNIRIMPGDTIIVP